ncbi:hypothetical protein LIER_43236 [Lithospermum erythrorhizon]|uniref:DUF309 domain-containing protein n=1 Tax=Lithospermum erythrorhizon TaxID=34254 RepID=A0AAV3PT84_LITER
MLVHQSARFLISSGAMRINSSPALSHPSKNSLLSTNSAIKKEGDINKHRKNWIFKDQNISYLSYPSSRNGSTSCSAPILVHAFGHLRVHDQALSKNITTAYRFTTRGGFIDEDEEEEEHGHSFDNISFQQAVVLFNSREYYKCHDVLEALWNNSNDPLRILYHGILQCAVGLHHLFNQNHRGAMMELGEGVCKLRKLNFESGPFHQFEQEISAVLDFIYQTQVELAACTDEVCLTMDRSERSYQLLGGFAAGQRLYHLDSDDDKNVYIYFRHNKFAQDNQKIKVPLLHASEDHLIEF